MADENDGADAPKGPFTNIYGTRHHNPPPRQTVRPKRLTPDNPEFEEAMVAVPREQRPALRKFLRAGRPAPKLDNGDE